MTDRDEADIVEQELERLAATRAAIDPNRRSTRRDIVVNAAIGHLATNGRSTTARLRKALSAMFHTQAVTEVELEEVLRGAQSAHLIESVSGANGEQRWQATSGVIAEAQQDREWAAALLARLNADVVSRLGGLEHILTLSQTNKTTQDLIRILAAGCSTAMNGHNFGVEHLRPVEFNRQAIDDALRRLEPASYRGAMSDLVQAACDPDDPFGAEIVHHLVVSSVLVCFIKKNDLAATPSLASTRLLLDTQVLVELVDEGSPEQEVVRSLIQLTLGLGGEVYVAEHSIAEWERLWSAADTERPDSVDDSLIFEAASRLTSNPFIGQFLRARINDKSLKWRRFQISRGNVRSVLQELGVVVRPHGNQNSDDLAVVDQVKQAMKGARGSSGHLKSNASIDADAQSAAMVARWRRNNPDGVCSGYFVSADSTTGRAYRRVASTDQTPLTVRPGAWLMYAAYLTGDPAGLADLADIVSSAVVRESFSGMATAYTLDEVVRLSEMLREDHQAMSLEDSREAAQLDIDSLLANPEDMTREAVVTAVGTEILQKRSARRDARAKHAEQLAGEVRELSEATAASATDRATRAEDEKARLQRELDETKIAGVGEAARLKRLLSVVVVAAVLVIALVVLVITGVIRSWGIYVAVLGAVWYGVAGVKYVTSTAPGRELLLGSIGDSVAMILAWVLGRIH